jgi:hypothetical protein
MPVKALQIRAKQIDKMVTCLNMKTKRLSYLIAAITLFVVACGSNEDKKVAPPETKAELPEDTTLEELQTEGLSRENIDTFSTMAFSSYAKKQKKDFDWSRFRLEHNWVDSSMYTTSWSPTKDYYDRYGRFLKYSPDSALFIDLDSYNIDIQKDKKGNLIGTEVGPDVEVSLINTKTGKKTRVLFFGPGNSVEDALWLDKDNIAIMGTEEREKVGKVAAIWKYNIPTNSFYQYELQDSVVARRLVGYWRRERLKEVKAKLPEL